MEPALPAVILAAAAFAAGYLFGRRAERDDWRREPDSVPGKEFGRWHRGRLYLVRRVDPPDSDGP